MITHIVIWKFKKNEEENVNKFLDELKSLYGIIDVIKHMKVKKSVDFNNDFNAILISKFNTKEDLEKYKKDPRHIKVSNLCKDIRINRTSIDIED